VPPAFRTRLGRASRLLARTHYLPNPRADPGIDHQGTSSCGGVRDGLRQPRRPLVHGDSSIGVCRLGSEAPSLGDDQARHLEEARRTKTAHPTGAGYNRPPIEYLTVIVVNAATGEPELHEQIGDTHRAGTRQ
jgi:hypothetical protein